MKILILFAALLSPAYSATVLRIACGSSTAVTDAQGNVWSADNGSTSGAVWTAANQANMATMAVPYRTLRYSSPVGAPVSYRIHLPSAEYSVTLKFTEPNKTAAGTRQFTLQLQGSAVAALDLVAAIGTMKPWDLTYRAVVNNDGLLMIDLVPSIGNAVISGIQVDTVDPPAVSTSKESTCELRLGEGFGPGLVPGVYHYVGCENMGLNPAAILRIRCRADNNGGTLDVMVRGPNGLQSILPAAIPCIDDGTTQTAISGAQYPAGEALHWMVRVNDVPPPHYLLATVALEASPGPAIPRLASFFTCEGSGITNGAPWDCSDYFLSEVRRVDGSMVQIIGILYDSSMIPPPSANWVAAK